MAKISKKAIIERARDKYAIGSDIEIDDAPQTSHAAGSTEGCFVAAWVWVALDDGEELGAWSYKDG